jgi:hypothetical protein
MKAVTLRSDQQIDVLQRLHPTVEERRKSSTEMRVLRRGFGDFAKRCVALAAVRNLAGRISHEAHGHFGGNH